MTKSFFCRVFFVSFPPPFVLISEQSMCVCTRVVSSFLQLLYLSLYKTYFIISNWLGSLLKFLDLSWSCFFQLALAYNYFLMNFVIFCCEFIFAVTFHWKLCVIWVNDLPLWSGNLILPGSSVVSSAHN